MRITLLIAVLLLAGCVRQQKFTSIIEPERASEYIGKVTLNDNVSIRLLILKHCPDQMADEDSALAVQAANIAKSKGLDIKDIADVRVNKDGKTKVWSKKLDLEGLKKFVSEQMKVDAKPGDTLIVFTIGHGSEDGGLMWIGQREGVMKMLAEAAAENNQETLWWQLSCYAASNLPPISSLTQKQQELFSISASSPANKQSASGVEGKQMEELFSAMADKSVELDSDSDGIITAGEFGAFMTKKFGKERGSLIYARSKDEPIFGILTGLANQIPIVDRNNKQGTYPNGYIPTPLE